MDYKNRHQNMVIIMKASMYSITYAVVNPYTPSYVDFRNTVL